MVLDLATLALMIALPFGLGISPLMLPRRRLRFWGPLLSASLLAASAGVAFELRDAPHSFHYPAFISFAIGWLLAAFLLPARLRNC